MILGLIVWTASLLLAIAVPLGGGLLLEAALGAGNGAEHKED